MGCVQVSTRETANGLAFPVIFPPSLGTPFRRSVVHVSGGSERCEARALFSPIRWNAAAHRPVGCEAERLCAFHDLTQQIRCKEGQADHLLNTAGKCVLGLGNLFEGLALFYEPVPVICLGDVPDKSFVQSNWSICDDDPGFDTALSQLEWGFEGQVSGVRFVRVSVESIGKLPGRQFDLQRTRRKVNALDKFQDLLSTFVS